MKTTLRKLIPRKFLSLTKNNGRKGLRGGAFPCNLKASFLLKCFPRPLWAAFRRKTNKAPWWEPYLFFCAGTVQCALRRKACVRLAVRERVMSGLQRGACGGHARGAAAGVSGVRRGAVSTASRARGLRRGASMRWARGTACSEYREQGRGATVRHMQGAARYSAKYCASSTGSSHSLETSSPGKPNAKWLNQLSFWAPCQCLTFAGISTISPGLSA